MLWLLLACSSPAPIAPDALAAAAVEAGWAREGCRRTRTSGVDTVMCTVRRDAPHEAVAVLTQLTYDRAADAERAWDRAQAVGWRDGRWVLQVDVYRPDRARALLDAAHDDPLQLPAPWVGTCTGTTCRGSDPRGEALLVVRSDADAPVPLGHVAAGTTMAAVTDRPTATALRDQLRPRLTIP